MSSDKNSGLWLDYSRYIHGNGYQLIGWSYPLAWCKIR